mmetsp:Transcript_24672/g.79777  ORF Transcript_24672/g.79777 Transcript_24672/m.79777 type:complete len:673 (-) Transcript_24672:499-2517(-)
MWPTRLLLLNCAAVLALTTTSLSRSTAREGRQVYNSDMAAMSVGHMPKAQKLDKINEMKLASSNLRHPLKDELADLESISISHDSYNLLKFHGSYQQDDRSKRQKGQERAYQFMLRLKVPGGECPGAVYSVLDELCEKYGQQDLRITTRQAWQIHGILKKDLKTVIRAIMDSGSTTIGGCGDINRNVMVPPAPIEDDLRPQYRAARHWTALCAELFVPQTTAFSEIWCDGEKLASVQYWKRHITVSEGVSSGMRQEVKPVAKFAKEDEAAVDARIQAMMRDDNGRGIVLPSSATVEPIYGDSYLPRKFKIGVTVEGDNSIDVYINDVSLVVLDDLSGVNVLVGGGLGRTHGKETTFARAAEELAFVPNANVPAVLKAIVAVQRDHGNREVRANARLKYLVHTLGIEVFRTLVEAYLGGEALLSPRQMKPWRYSDWLGWHSAGDGTLFCGLNIEQGRVRDFDGEGSPQWRSFLRSVIDSTGCDLTLTPSQSVVLRNIPPIQRSTIDDLMKKFNILPVEAVDPIIRLSMACPALPLCGLAVTEAERYLPTMLRRVRLLLDHLGLDGEELLIRMTGCPNGCARPYMAELAFVGDGKASYQLYIGGSPMLTRVGFAFKDRCQLRTIEHDLEPLFVMWRDKRHACEAFGDFVHRVGKDMLVAFSSCYTPSAPVFADL